MIGRLWKNGSFLVIDTETTGLRDDVRIVSVGLVEFYKGRPIEKWACVCNPGPGVEWEHEDVAGALFVNGLRKKDLLSAPPLRYFMPRIAAYCDRVPIWAGHNLRFDLDLLNLGCHVRRPPDAIIDTILVDCVLDSSPGHSRALRALAERARLPTDNLHDAVGDALTVGRYLSRHWDALPTFVEGLHAMMKLGAGIRMEQLRGRGKDVQIDPPSLIDHVWVEGPPGG
jgi:DNA polymerase III epsilon subunit-like protein